MRQGISRLMPYNRHHQWIAIITSFLLFLRIGTLAFSPSVWHTSKTRVVATTTTRHPTCLRSDTIDRLEECTLVPLQSIVNTHPSITIDETGNLCLGDDVLVDALTPDLTTELFYPTPTTTTLTRETAEDATTRPLILLDEDGNLRLGDKVLLDGLTNDIWSSSAISLSSIFLHTSYETQSPEHESQLGEIHCRNLLACARQTRYWMGPKVGKTSRDVPFDTQFLLVEVSENGPYVLILPLVDNGFRASLHVDKSNVQVTCAAESGDAAVTCCGMRALYVGVHNDDPFQLLKMGFAQVAKATGTFDVLSNKRLPKSIDTFGWCTWDAFYSKVTPQGVLEGVRKLRDIGVPPRTVIIDDGWQQVTPTPPTERAPDLSTLHYLQQGILDTIAKPVGYFYEKFVRRAPHGSFGNRLWSFLSKTTLKKGLWEYFDSTSDFNRQVSGFEANSKFENTNTTLKGLVTELKDVLGVQTVLAWHALHGTWRGVSPELGKKYDIRVTNVHPQPSELLMRLEPQIEWDPVSLFGAGLLSDPKDLAKFYELLHKPLVDAGVDGVKVDVQSGVSALGAGVGGGPHLAKIYVNAMENSVVQNFQGENGAVNCINCMCHSTENLYRYKITSVARASDDFYPRRPESHTAHLINVAYNSLFLGEICQPDWDMFHSLHESAGLHAAARAVGGCPVYVSDAPGHHDPELLRKLVLPDGSVLRAKLPGRPTRDCLFVDVANDEKSALKIWNQNPSGGVICATNVQGVAWNFNTHENEVLNPNPPAVTAEIKPFDIETLRGEEGPFVAFRHRSSTLEFLSKGDTILRTKLNSRDWEIFTIVPVQIRDSVLWAPIGLADMLNSGGAIQESADGGLVRDGSSIETSFLTRGPGRFVGFTNRRPSQVIVNAIALGFTYDAEDGELSFLLPPETHPGSAHRVTVMWDKN